MKNNINDCEGLISHSDEILFYIDIKVLEVSWVTYLSMVNNS